jgi:hypothetical protein
VIPGGDVPFRSEESRPEAAPTQDGARATLPPRQPTAPDQETDVWWGGYSSWAMLPSFAACVLFSIATIVTAILVCSVYHIPGDEGRYAVYGVVGGLWLFQGVRWGYRVGVFAYRLTNRRLFCWNGSLYPPIAPVALAEVRQVLVFQSAWQRRVKVGWITVATADRTVLLSGVRDPTWAAALIERRAREARGL